MTRPTRRATRSAIAGLGLVLAFEGLANAAPPASRPPAATPAPSPPAPPAPSPSAPQSNEMRAEGFFRSGEKKFDSGQHTEACLDFSESLKLGPKLGTLLNLALCHETVGRVATAWREFNYAAAWAAQNGQKDRHDFALQHITALEPKLPRVLLHLPHERAIASVEVDGEPIAEQRWYLPLYLDPGEHAVAVNAPGKQRSHVTFRVVNSPTEQIVVVPQLADESSPRDNAPAAPPAPPAESPFPRVLGWSLLGAGAVGVATSAILGALAISTRDDVGTHCRGNVCDSVGFDRYESAQGLATASTVMFVVGGALGAAGIWLVVTHPKQQAPTVGLKVRSTGFSPTLGLEGTF